MLTTLTPPSALIDSSDAALRQHLRLEDDETDQDALIDAYCLAAVGHVENYTRRRLVTQTVRLTLDCFGWGGIWLPIDPVQSVDQVAYTDGAGVEQVMASSAYRLIASGLPTKLHPAYGASWPVPRPDKGAVRIDLVVGYGAASAVPAEIVQAARMLVGLWFVPGREVVGPSSQSEMPYAVQSLLAPHRLWL